MADADQFHDHRCRSRSCRYLGAVPHRIAAEGETEGTRLPGGQE